VPRSVWPQAKYRCDENNGAGWTVQITNYSTRTGAATVAFLNATTARGLPYQDADLDLKILQPV
jgi:hypothetical protein